MRCFECSSISSANDEGKERQRSRYGAQDLPREDRGLKKLGADLSKGFICGGFVKKCRNNAWTRQQKRQCLDKAEKKQDQEPGKPWPRPWPLIPKLHPLCSQPFFTFKALRTIASLGSTLRCLEMAMFAVEAMGMVTTTSKTEKP